MVSQYTIFFYLGIFLFVVHTALYGVGIDLSFFGLLLIYIGWRKPVLYNWFFWLLWVFIALEVISNFRIIRDRLLESPKKNRLENDDKLKKGGKEKKWTKESMNNKNNKNNNKNNKNNNKNNNNK